VCSSDLGDGSFFPTKKTTFDAFNIDLDFGVSIADWDNDGDVDVTSLATFRRNQFLEEGQRHFTLATHDLDGEQLGLGTPAWFDWDKDGDIDTAFGGGPGAFLLEN